MRIGVISDTHSDRANALPHIVREFKNRNVDVIVHCGDIEIRHIGSEIFGDFEVFCALNQEQLEKPDFKNLLEYPPPNWKFTSPPERIFDLRHVRCYVGHKRSFDFLFSPETKFEETLEFLRKDHDGLRWVFAGHSHQQVCFQNHLISFVNPGAIEASMDGYEFAVVDTDTGQIIFSRIPKTKPVEEPFSIGVISDSLDISKLDVDFWQKLKKEFEDRGVTHIIHCGNIAVDDIGREELKNFTVRYKLRKKQVYLGKPPKNWEPIPEEEPIVEINGRQFYIHSALARILLEESGAEMHKECLKTLESYPEVSFIFYGGTSDAFLQEGQRARIINPGGIIPSRSFAVICFPRTEITFGYVPIDPLPPIED